MALTNQTIKVSTEALGRVSGEISSEADNFKDEYDRLYADVDAMGAKWEGEDYNEFKNEMASYKPELQKMYQLMKDYSTYLNKTKSEYETAQNEIKKNAGAIVTSR